MKQRPQVHAPIGHHDACVVVLVHDWLTGMRGGEKCLERLCRLWPKAPIFTLIHRRGAVSPLIEDHPIRTSLLQRLPCVHRYYRYLLPIMPKAVNWSIPPCDVVISCSHCVAKAATPPPGAVHICYCFTPMRYAWHMRDAYFRDRGIKALIRDRLLEQLRQWDRATAQRVDRFVAISKTVQNRIRECYGRDSTVIYPPVDTDFYCPDDVKREDFYLVVGALAPYKRTDLAIEACRQLRRRLVVIGTGQDEKRLKSLAGDGIIFLGRQPDSVIRDYLQRCRALLFPGEEDFGIVPLEAQACGTPVVAYGRGGATETVRPPGLDSEPTGLWFDEQTPESLCAAIERFERLGDSWDPRVLRKNALRFRGDRFEREMLRFVENVLQGEQKSQAA